MTCRLLSLTKLLLLSAGILVVPLFTVATAQETPTPAATHSPASHGDDKHHAVTPDGHHEAPHDEGVPGLSFRTDLALWSLITFLLFLAVLYKLAWGPLTEGLDRREAKIHGDIATAEANRLKSEQLLRDHERRLADVEAQVKEILAEARRDAEHTRSEILQTAQQDAEATRSRAIADIERARDQALVELSDYLQNLVSEATAKVVSQSLSGPDHERLIRESLNEVSVRRN